jgi:small-conductance mechanosensitive channel
MLPPVPFLYALLTELREAHTAWVVGGLLLTLVLVKRSSGDGRRLRTATVFTGLHLLLALVAGALRAADSRGWQTVHLTAQGIAAVAAVGMAISLVFGGLLPRLGLRPPRILGDVVGGAALFVALLGLAASAGFDLSGVIATSAVLTAVIGLALQDTLGNLVGGLALQLDKSISVGDWVRYGEVVGKVTDIRWRYTALETRNWETLIVPNGQLVKNNLLVLGRRGGAPAPWRRTLYVNVDYRHPPQRVIVVLEEAMRASPIRRVATTPTPQALFFDYAAEGYARYAVRYWLADLDVDDPTDSDVRLRVYNALERAGIQPALPGAARLLVREEERRDEETRRDREARFAAISRTELFVGLPEEDRRELADGLRVAPYGAGEVVTRQGDVASWLFLLASGEVSVRVEADGLEHEVSRLGPGSILGEMAMMTGEPRSATVVALSDCVCYRLERAAFEAVLRRRPQLAEDVAAVLARRRAQLDDLREDLDALARERRVNENEGALVNRIRSFFGLDEN